MVDNSDKSGASEQTTPPVDVDNIQDVVIDTSGIPDWSGGVEPPNPEDEEDKTAKPNEGTGEEGTSFAKRTGDLAGGDVDIDKPGEGDDDLTSFYSGVGSILKGKSFLGSDVEIKTEEDLVNAFEKEVQGRLDSATKQALEYRNQGIPIGEVSKIQQAISAANAIDESTLGSNVELSKNLITTEFVQKGFSQEDAEGFVTLFEEKGILEAEAIKALGSRKGNLKNLLSSKVEEYKQANKEQEEAVQESIRSLVDKVNKGEVFGRKLNKNTVSKVDNMLNTVVGYSAEGEPVNALMKYKLENPVDFEHKLLYLFTITDGFDNLNSFDRSAESRISRHFKDSVTNLNSGKSFTDKQATPKVKLDLDTIDDIVI